MRFEYQKIYFTVIKVLRQNIFWDKDGLKIKFDG